MDGSDIIKVDILQRSYSVRVKKQDEDIFLKAAQSIEQSIQRYAAKDAVYRDKQDLLAMALLESTVSALRLKKEKTENTIANDVTDKLKDINNFLSLHIQNK